MTRRKVLGVYGAGGFGHEVMSLIPSIMEDLFSSARNNLEVYFIDDDSNAKGTDDTSVISLEKFLAIKNSDLFYNIAIADPQLRKNVQKKMEKTSGTPVSFIFRNTQILSRVNIESGAIIMPGAVVSTKVALGQFAHLNFNSYVAHDCKIGDFVTISPNVTCCGNTHIGGGVLIGAGSSIKQGQPKKPRLIGENSILGIGSVLISDLPEGKTFFGNPARERT